MLCFQMHLFKSKSNNRQPFLKKTIRFTMIISSFRVFMWIYEGLKLRREWDATYSLPLHIQLSGLKGNSVHLKSSPLSNNHRKSLWKEQHLSSIKFNVHLSYRLSKRKHKEIGRMPSNSSTYCIIPRIQYS